MGILLPFNRRSESLSINSQLGNKMKEMNEGHRIGVKALEMVAYTKCNKSDFDFDQAPI
jgi:hypothetical protein